MDDRDLLLAMVLFHHGKYKITLNSECTHLVVGKPVGVGSFCHDICDVFFADHIFFKNFHNQWAKSEVVASQSQRYKPNK